MRKRAGIETVLLVVRDSTSRLESGTHLSTIKLICNNLLITGEAVKLLSEGHTKFCGSDGDVAQVACIR